MIHRVAAMWCRAHAREPYNRSEVAKWVKREFGPLLGAQERERLSKELLGTIRRHLRVRRRRSRDVSVDYLTTPQGSPERIGRLLASRLGPARRWVGQGRALQETPRYIDGAFYSGLVAGLVPVRMRLRRINNPNLLVYSHAGAEPASRFVPGHITTVADAFIWLIPNDARDFLRLPEVRVEHDGVDQSVRLITPWGTKVLPWRELASTSTTV